MARNYKMSAIPNRKQRTLKALGGRYRLMCRCSTILTVLVLVLGLGLALELGFGLALELGLAIELALALGLALGLSTTIPPVLGAASPPLSLVLSGLSALSAELHPPRSIATAKAPLNQTLMFPPDLLDLSLRRLPLFPSFFHFYLQSHL